MPMSRRKIPAVSIMCLGERGRLRLAFATLVTLSLGAWGLSPLVGPDAAAVLAALMGAGALPALLLHWVRPAGVSMPAPVAAAILSLPGLGLSLQLWHDVLIARGLVPVASLPICAAVLVCMQAVALRAETPRASGPCHEPLTTNH